MKKKRNADNDEPPGYSSEDDTPFTTWLLLNMIPILILIGLATLLGYTEMLRSEAEGCTHFLVRLVFFFAFQIPIVPWFSSLFLEPTKALAKSLPGAVELQHGSESQDDSIEWPSKVALESLPTEWRQAKGKQPFFLNHVRGSMRIKSAATRMGSAVGSVVSIFLVSWLLEEGRPLSALGLHMNQTFIYDSFLGAVTGATLVLLMCVVEWSLGWIKLIGVFETCAPGESFALNLVWDLIFHVAVTISEEIPMRGWLLLNSAEACSAHLGLGCSASLALACVGQTLLFASLHASSPGANMVGMINLALGGTAGALNVLLCGNLGFTLSWHLAWNYVMGNIVGLSTSGIPISATVLSFAPHPQKAHLHGGTFGPEQSVLAPGAYILGTVILVALYGLERYPMDISAGFPSLAAHAAM